MLRLLSSLEARTRASKGAITWARSISSIAASFSPPPPPSSSSSSSSSSFFDRLSDVLTPEIVADSLVSRGYAVVDNALSADTSRLLRGEIDALSAAGLLRPNATFLVKGGSSSTSSGEAAAALSLSSATLLEKRGIWETDAWSDAAVSERAPFLSAGQEGAKSLAALLSVLCPEHFSLSGPAILKAQLNDGLERGEKEGGGREAEGEEKRERALSSSLSSSSPSSSRDHSPAAPSPFSPFSSLSSSSPPSFPCFPIHFDSDESVDGRRVTAIFYVSEKKKEEKQPQRSSKDEEEGGELLLWPELFRPKRSPTSSPSPLLPLAIPAVEGRLVLFSACRMPHAVSPSRRRRHCFTVWLSEGEEVRRRKRTAEEKKGGGRGRVLSSAGGRRAAARVLLSSTWRRSLVAAHPPGPALDAALETHDGDTRKLAEILKEARAVAEVVGSDGETSWELASDDDDDSQPMLWF